MEIGTAVSEIESKYDFTFKEKQLTAIKSIIENKDTIDLCLQTYREKSPAVYTQNACWFEGSGCCKHIFID